MLREKQIISVRFRLEVSVLFRFIASAFSFEFETFFEIVSISLVFPFLAVLIEPERLLNIDLARYFLEYLNSVKQHNPPFLLTAALTK